MVAPSLGVSLKRKIQKQRDTSQRFPAASLGSKPGSFSASGSFPGPSSSSKPHLTCTLILTQPRKLLHRTYDTLSHFATRCLIFPPFSSFSNSTHKRRLGKQTQLSCIRNCLNCLQAVKELSLSGLNGPTEAKWRMAKWKTKRQTSQTVAQASRWLLSRRRRRIDGLPCPSPSGSMSF